MKPFKILFYNVFIFFILIFFIETFLISLNYFFEGVPIYKQLNLSSEQVVYHKKKKNMIDNKKTLDDYYIKSFDGYDKQSYLEKYIITNDIDLKDIRYIKGEDINFPIFYDKNNCRENKNQNYIFSDVALIGDSYLFGIAVASPHDIVGRLRHLNPEKDFLNLGMPGTDPREQVNHLKKITKSTNFNNLVWLFYEGNDFEVSNNQDSRCSYHNLEPETLKRKFLLKKDSLLPFKIFLAEHLRGLASFAKLFISYDKKFNLNKPYYEETVKELNDYLDTKGVKNKFLFYIPSYNRHAYKNNYFIHPNVKKLNILKNDVNEIVTKYGFIFIDGDEAVKDVSNKLDLYHYNYPTHYNAVGYSSTADHLSSFLKD
tara:strand:- start:52 stop:1164 length:1113 start_codon:yes stop_codon:yes gene_type:complete